MAYLTRDGHFLQVNRRLTDLILREPGELVGRALEDVVHVPHRRSARAGFKRLAGGEVEVLVTELRLVRSDEETVGAEVTASLVRGTEEDDPGRVLVLVRPTGIGSWVAVPKVAAERHYARLLATVPVSIWEEDWTEVIAAVRALDVDSLDAFQAYLDENPDFVAWALRQVRILDVNEYTREMFGAENKEELVRSLELVFSTEDTLPGFRRELEALFEGRTDFRTKMALRTVDGRLIRVLLSMSFPDEDDPSGWVPVTLMDISDLEQVREELQQANRDLETLLYISSHDLREPLRAIETFSRMVADRYGDRLDDKGRDFLRRVVRGAERMDQLFRDLLDLSRAGRMDVSGTTVVDGRALVDAAMDQLGARIRETQAVVDVAEVFAPLNAQPTWAGRAVYNLLSNALKFSRPGESPHVVVTPWVTRDEVGIRVRDHGPGVPEEQRDRIFQLFQRAVGRDVPGTGAGLAIVRQVAERHGGRVWIQDPDGPGAEFVVTFGPPPVVGAGLRPEVAPGRRGPLPDQ